MFIMLEAFFLVFSIVVSQRTSAIRNSKPKVAKRNFLLCSFVSLAFKVGILSLITSDVYDSFAMVLPAILAYSFAIVYAIYIASSLKSLSEYGLKLNEEVLGYRDFLEKVEVEQLKRLIDQDPEYYYHNLAYAMVFELEDKWAAKFSELYLEPASWYIGEEATDYLFYSSMARRFTSNYAAATAAVATKAGNGQNTGGSFTSSGSSGFAGGGFGGGGGRSW